jgi:murein DD-endopeptidase MepM/ murein hydrolase activator NlpD
LAAAEGSMTDLEAQADQGAQAVAQAEAELAAFKAGSAIYIDGVVFPVAEPYDHPLVGTFGAPRMPGTPDAHWHEGIDIFAPAGTPLLAAERGVVTSIGTNRLGGLSVWLRGESGTDWYYAHLSAFAPDLVPMMVVEAGHVLGYVGNSGNALSTPSHVHLEIHPGGGDAVDPYPFLRVLSERDARR